MPSKKTSVAAVLSMVLLFVASTASAQIDQPRVGTFKDKKTLVEMYGENFVNGIAEHLPPEFEVEFQLFVPETYDPENPPGVLIYITPFKTGHPGRNWDRFLREENLIWAGVNKSGNSKDKIQRVFEAIASLDYIQQEYQINQSRKYLTGFSVGGITASALDQNYPGWFDGAIYIAGAVGLENMPAENIDAAKSKPYVFLVGKHDPARPRFKKAFRAYERAGFEKLKYMEIRNMAHRLPSLYDMQDALIFLDENRRDYPTDSRE